MRIIRQIIPRQISFHAAFKIIVAALLFAILFLGIETPATRAQSTPSPPSAPVATQVGDAAGDKTGGIEDIATGSGPLPEDVQARLATQSGKGMPLVAEAVGQNRVGINIMWTLLAAFMVMFMQAGFALVETGFTRAKNAAHTMLMNFSVYFLAILGFWIAGFAIMLGNAGEISNLGGTVPLAGGHAVSIPGLGTIFGTNGFFLAGTNYDIGVYVLFIFHMVFMDTAATIPTGAMAERWKFKAFIVYAFFMSLILYPVFAHWAWGGGWLSQLGNNFQLGVGYVDFAGSGVVHTVGGFCALAGAAVLGPRIGKFNKDGSSNAIPGHNLPFALLGTMILAFGWFGFNAGSTLGAAGAGNLRIGIVAVTTMLASAGGGAAAMIYLYWTTKRPDPTMIANGFLGGLVAITAPCAFVSAPIAVLIGAIAGVLVCLAVPFVDKLLIDDPVGAISVHGACGFWGVLCVGLFADGTYGNGFNGTVVNGVAVPLKGLFMGGGFGQLGAQLVGGVTAVLWAFGASFLFFKIQDRIMGIRSHPEDEIEGLDIPETGILAYPSFSTETENELAAHSRY